MKNQKYLLFILLLGFSMISRTTLLAKMQSSIVAYEHSKKSFSTKRIIVTQKKRKVRTFKTNDSSAFIFMVALWAISSTLFVLSIFKLITFGITAVWLFLTIAMGLIALLLTAYLIYYINRSFTFYLSRNR